MSESKPGDAQGPLECGPALRDRFCVLSLLETLLEASFRRRKAVPQGGTALQNEPGTCCGRKWKTIRRPENRTAGSAESEARSQKPEKGLLTGRRFLKPRVLGCGKAMAQPGGMILGL